MRCGANGNRNDISSLFDNNYFINKLTFKKPEKRHVRGTNTTLIVIITDCKLINHQDAYYTLKTPSIKESFHVSYVLNTHL